MAHLFGAMEVAIYSIASDSIKLPVIIKPQANQNKILGIINGRLKIAIAATPVDGRANKELVSFLAKLLALRKQEVVILNGLTNPLKLLELPITVKPILDKIIMAY